MTDKELIELSAKAAGYNYAKNGGYIVVDGIPGNWNPLSDDGDALRLAVKLEFRIGTHCNHEQAYASPIHGECDPQVEDWNGDPYAATRRAIVRAAAEVGRNMK